MLKILKRAKRIYVYKGMNKAIKKNEFVSTENINMNKIVVNFTQN